MTHDTASLYGLLDRGVLAVGKKADLNVIDFDTLGLAIPEYVNDLPAGAGRLVQRARGYDATICAGEVDVPQWRADRGAPGQARARRSIGVACGT